MQTSEIPVDTWIGKTVRDRYQISHQLGKGAMGIVYKATQLNDGKPVALKVLHTHLSSDADAIKRFQYEAKAASTLMHPNIVRLYDFGMTQTGQPYIAMEFLEGQTLGQLIREKKFFDTKDALPIIRQTCEALAEAHSHGVLHRDIKPANIMVMPRFGQENFVVVLDFSISKVIQTASDVEQTTTGLLFGSPAYMSPERFMGKGGDFRADIYSMGIIMFQMLAGRPPFKSADIYALMNDHVSAEPPKVKDLRPESDVPDSLEATIACALMKDPKQRQSNMKQVLSEINEVYAEMSSLTRPVEPLNDPMPGEHGYRGVMGDARPDLDPVQAAIAPVRQDFPVFDIFSGSQSSKSPVTPSQAQSQAQMPARSLSRKRDESQGLKTAEIGQTSSQWEKSLVAKPASQRPNIRPPERSQKLPQLMVAVLAVMIAAGFLYRSFSPASGNGNVPASITTLIRSNNLAGAMAVLQSWHPSTNNSQEQESYASSCLSLGKAFMHKKDPGAALGVLDLVPTGTRVSFEARNLARQCKKAVPGS